jgi:DNA repair protein RecN (Recombination protein N)
MVTAELAALAMPDAVFSVDIQTRGGRSEYNANGADEIAFMLEPHPGAGPRPLGKGASGGELSRVMLAIEVALAGADPVPTFVFDEVDAGVGGRAAVEVGRRLARLGRTSQVLVVTHLPQVAAFADHHVVVTKDAGGMVTASSIRVVQGEERVAELVRMLSGLEASDAGVAHARELLAVAADDRGQG